MMELRDADLADLKRKGNGEALEIVRAFLKSEKDCAEVVAEGQKPDAVRSALKVAIDVHSLSARAITRRGRVYLTRLEDMKV